MISKQIGWSQESNLLWEILRQLNRLGGVISSLIAKVVNLEPKYKVFTALLTQSGDDEKVSLIFNNAEPFPTIIIGTTYTISEIGDDIDFTLIGAPDNNVGTNFIATGVNPGTGSNSAPSVLDYTLGAPVAVILENTIGNIWFNYEGDGMYAATSDDLFTIGKTWNTNVIVLGVNGPADRGVLYQENSSVLGIRTESDVDVPSNNILSSTPIEIRVYS